MEVIKWILSSIGKVVVWLKDLPLPVQITVVIVLFGYIFYWRWLRHIEKKWKYKYKAKKTKEKEETKRMKQKTRQVKALSKNFVQIIQSNDWVKRVKAIVSGNRIVFFDKLEQKKKQLTDDYENAVIDTLKEEVLDMSPGEKTPVRKSDEGKRMKPPKKRKGVSEN